MPQAVIFDMDGVIIDSEPLWHKAMIAGFTQHGLPFTEADSRITTGMRIDEVIAFWNNKQPFTQNETLVKENIEDTLCDLIRAEGKAMSGLHQTLALLAEKKITIALATSSSTKLMNCVLSVLQIEKHFKHIQSAEGLSYGKPHPEVFLKCAQHINTKPANCLVIEDSLNGIIAAKAAGMAVIAVPEPHNVTNPKFAVADLMLSSLFNFNEEVLARF